MRNTYLVCYDICEDKRPRSRERGPIEATAAEVRSSRRSHASRPNFTTEWTRSSETNPHNVARGGTVASCRASTCGSDVGSAHTFCSQT